MRSVSLGTSVLPRVATEMVCRARLIVTASRAGSSARASTTERARHFAGSASRSVSDSVVTLINHLRHLYHIKGGWTMTNPRRVLIKRLKVVATDGRRALFNQRQC